ncbi:hypothetical protein KQH21_06740 [Streptomyces sp. IpFD-1.1]|uniref:hypothetical protein n=1 Tax=Streptomyces sp. IpFD-1.1 TaxID=2841664 RepID=UPI002094DE62|nr:hypothetical protein [Streptomyces sp. IpFD-1.1]MCO6747869.1 hypothetical protein [Streptomyces sp. IpFD-1.1]
MIREWAAVEGDLSREHHVSASELAAMSVRRFLVLVGSLTPDSRFAQAWRRTPRRVDSPEEIARITGLPAT